MTTEAQRRFRDSLGRRFQAAKEETSDQQVVQLLLFGGWRLQKMLESALLVKLWEWFMPELFPGVPNTLTKQQSRALKLLLTLATLRMPNRAEIEATHNPLTTEEKVVQLAGRSAAVLFLGGSALRLKRQLDKSKG